MTAKEQLASIFGKSFEQQENITEVRRYYSNNTFCLDGNGDIVAIFSSENDYEHIHLPAHLSKLQYLNLSDNSQLKKLTFESAMPALEHLDVSDSKLEELKLPEGFRQLRWVDVSRNQLQIFELEGAMPSLNFLDIGGNQIETLSLPSCPTLEEVYALENRISSFRISSDCQMLTKIHLKDNLLETLPDNLGDLQALKTLYLHGNSLSSLPPEIIADGEYGNSAKAVLTYLRELLKDDIVNQRAKLIIVGNGRVGKTSLRHRLAGDDFNENEPYTHGIEFEKLNKDHFPEIHTDDLQLQVWDFGGQEIFYATHQFFLTEEAVYILAWTNEDNVKGYREEEKDSLPFDEKWRECEYWLENIRLHGKESPILMVQTHSDIRKNLQPIDAKWIEGYGVTTLNFSSKKKHGLDELRDIITDHLKEDISFLGQKFPRSYENIMASIEVRKKHEQHISLEQFNALCESVGIQEGKEFVLDYLRKVGLVIYFDKPKLKDIIYIDPNWLTEQVYKLINNKLRAQNGEIDQAYLQEVLLGGTYTPTLRAQFVELLKAFELIFQPKGEDFLVAPQYLPKELSRNAQRLHNSQLKQLSLAFVFRFPKFLPDNVIINLISRYGPYSDQVFWQHGISFTNVEGENCIIHYEEANKQLLVYSNDTENGKLLQREICKALIELSKGAYAEISLNGEDFVAWEKLEKQFSLLAQNPDQRILCVEPSKDVRVLDFVHFSDKVDKSFNRYFNSKFELANLQELLEDKQEKLAFFRKEDIKTYDTNQKYNHKMVIESLEKEINDIKQQIQELMINE